MGADRFVLTLIDTRQGKQEERNWSRGEIIKGMPWLKRMNARGYDVWLRPGGAHGLIMFDGLRKIDIDSLEHARLQPALVVSTGADRYQAWIKLSDQSVAADERTTIANSLRKSVLRENLHVVVRSDGRLAGLTNQQMLMRNSIHPFVKLLCDVGRPVSAAPVLLTTIRNSVNHVRAPTRGKSVDRQRGPER